MSDWTEWHLAPPVAANLEAMGWEAAHPRMREVAATTARGHNAVVIAPPSPAWSTPALAGVLSRLAATPGARALVIAPPDAVDEWGAHLAALVAGTTVRLLAARGPSRATRLLHEGGVDLLVTSADTALALLQRSALKTEALAAVVFAWPERWPGEEFLTLLMQDLPKDAQRLILSADPDVGAALSERYARRAIVVGPARRSETQGPVRVATTPWHRRVVAVAEVIELLDPASVVVWTVDGRLHAALRPILESVAPTGRLVTSAPESPAGLIIAVDLPDTETLTGLLAAGEVVLLAPPGSEAWLATAAAPRRPVQLPGFPDTGQAEVRRRRQLVVQAIESLDPVEPALVLGPLLERYDAPVVAAALYQLWSAQPAPRPEVTAVAAGGATTRLWLGAGRRDEVGVNELVAFLTREVAVDRAQIGKIEVRESFSLVEVPQAEAERIAEAVSGRTLRRRRMVARVDRGPGPGSGRPPRGRGAPSRTP